MKDIDMSEETKHKIISLYEKTIEGLISFEKESGLSKPAEKTINAFITSVSKMKDIDSKLDAIRIMQEMGLMMSLEIGIPDIIMNDYLKKRGLTLVKSDQLSTLSTNRNDNSETSSKKNKNLKLLYSASIVGLNLEGRHDIEMIRKKDMLLLMNREVIVISDNLYNHISETFNDIMAKCKIDSDDVPDSLNLHFGVLRDKCIVISINVNTITSTETFRVRERDGIHYISKSDSEAIFDSIPFIANTANKVFEFTYIEGTNMYIGEECHKYDGLLNNGGIGK